MYAPSTALPRDLAASPLTCIVETRQWNLAVPPMRSLPISHTLPTFDVLAELARNNPSGLEALRNRLTDEVIRRARNDPSRRRLMGLKFRIDMERRRSPDALAACIRLSAMMHRSLAQLQGVLAEPNVYRQHAEPGTVLGFPRPTTR